MQHWFRVAVMSLMLVAGLEAHAQTRAFKDWNARCPEAACAAETAAQAGQITLRISRGDAALAPWHISLHGLARSLAKGSPLTFQVDQGQSLKLEPGAGYRALDGDQFIFDRTALETLFPAMRKGNRLFVTFKHLHGIERRLAFSLSGLAATLLWIDERQDRVGTEQTVGPPVDPETAPAEAASPAPKPATAAEAAPPAPEAEAAPPAPEAEAAPPTPTPKPAAAPKPAPRLPVPPEVLARHRADPDCSASDTGPDKDQSTSGQLDATRSLFVLPCSTGAYNQLSKVYVYDTRYPKEIKPESFAAFSDRLGWYGKDYLINPDYDAATKTLSAFEKGRGLGDCGSRVRYAWTENGLRMVEYRYWGKCDGSRFPNEWPVVYTHEKTAKTP